MLPRQHTTHVKGGGQGFSHRSATDQGFIANGALTSEMQPGNAVQ